MNGLSSMGKDVLARIGEVQAEIDAMPKPAKWKNWEVREWLELRELGPRYSPAALFNGGNALPDRIRVQYLRTIHALAADGLLAVTSENGRMKFVKLTPAGRAALESLAGDNAVSPVANTPHEATE